MAWIDLNCDMGEGMDTDAAIMPYISSANIACGAHAGDAGTMQRTIMLALQHGVAIGAHPSFDDRLHFGRNNMQLPEPELYELVRGQIILLAHAAASLGARLHHVKPHGALYNMAAKEPSMSRVIAKAVADTDPRLVLYGLSHSALITAAAEAGLATASEVFADRSYQDDGSLTPRSQAGALIEDEDEAVKQALQLAQRHSVFSQSGKLVPVKAETICLHGDGAHAPAFARRIHDALKQKGIDIRTL